MVTLLKQNLIAEINLSKCGEKSWDVREAQPFPFPGWPCSIYSGQRGGILLPWPPGSYPPFFCIYSTLIFLWETIPRWLSEHLFHMLLTPLWDPARRTSRIISKMSTWFNKKSMRTMLRAFVQTLGTSHFANAREEAIWEWCQPKGKQSWEM